MIIMSTFLYNGTIPYAKGSHASDQPTLSADDIPPGPFSEHELRDAQDDWRDFTPFEPCWDQVWPDLHGAWPVRP